MNDPRRTLEASGLRNFFDEQIEHLHGLFCNFTDHIREEMQQAEKDRQIVEDFVDISNRKMRAVQGYADKLRTYVGPLYNHVLQIVNELPPPIALTPDTFKTNSLVNALFVNRDEISKLFETAPDVHNFWHNHRKEQTPELYAILTAHKTEKSILGIGMQGDMLVRDVPQQEVNFSDYKIHTPCASSAELDCALKSYLFNRVVALIKQEMDAHINNQPLFTSDHSYEAKLNSLANPDVYLNKLIEYIETPAALLTMEKSHFRVSKLGIKLSDDDQQSANEFDLCELLWRDNLRVVVLQIIHANQ